METISSFTGGHAYLSNFAASTICDPRWELTWPTAEHLFQAHKTDRQHLIRIHQCDTPGEAKKMGRKVPLTPGWDQRKRMVMLQVLLWKFGQNDHLADLLRQTSGHQLVEGNTWGDTYWGAVSLAHAERYSTPLPVWDGMQFHGHNWLGRTLMMVREVL